MSSDTHKNSSQKSGLDLILFTIPQEMLLQIGTASMLAGLLAQRTITQTLQAIGSASEEVFRGDRLPLLNFPNTEDDVAK
ncbi:MAG: hypothetical protein VKL59_23885 [Nostocaceae cyanobacterium]|nr:hypothetical protein [Nostocaceae cyanobacterium]